MYPKGFLYRWRTEQSSILIVSLWAVSLLSAFAVSAGYQVRQKITLADRLDRRGWLSGLAEMGIHQAIQKLKADKVENGFDVFYDLGINEIIVFKGIGVGEGSFTVSYEFLDTESGTKSLRYGLCDEESKLNINFAEPVILASFFELFEVDEDQAEEIAYAIVDWRDTDGFLSHPTEGAEDDYYEDRKYAYGAKDFAFQVLQELLLVRGMTPEIYARVQGRLTVYGSGAVNINTASREVLLSLGLDESLVKKILDFRKGEDRKEGTADDPYAAQTDGITATLSSAIGLDGGEVASLSNLVAQGRLGVASTYFKIRSRGELKERGQAIDIEAIVDRNGKVVSWYSSIPRKLTAAELNDLFTELVTDSSEE
ncbi:MAG: general secretion pathway protein GspK [Candidatus Omnitrophica bacterium]|nr:general secretion pathway protein GspK [Candidatus Omnitrophota bacterium]